MSIRYPKGGTIPNPVTPAGPYQDGAASGVWGLTAQLQAAAQGIWPIAGNAAPVGLFGGGDTGYPSNINVIGKVIITTVGNATDFGDLNNATSNLMSCSSSSRGIFAGGYVTSPSLARINVIDYVTISSVGNATDFGDLTQARNGGAGFSSNTRGVFGGGYTTDAVNTIDYITIASVGNATDFGDLTQPLYGVAGCSSSTRGLIAGGVNLGSTAYVNVIQYVTIASAGNATDFGDTTQSEIAYMGGCSSATRGIFAGGFNPNTNVIQYVTIASTGNATDFGDLTLDRRRVAACSSSLRGLFGGGYTSAPVNVIDYITIASVGNATDFGDLTQITDGAAACSNAHGGL